ncbi:MAG TPA: DUF2911 domain-containing protein [Methylomirabilota bacterium]|nr:DUF2911 domain-containing protein [Methylomirabilota bacterium]
MLRQHSLRGSAGLLALLLACPVAAQDFTTPRPSPGAKVIQTVGTTEMSVTYSRPGVKNRVVWGGLVPWGKAWRTGANEITQFQSADDVWVEGQKLAAGTYALVTTPNPDAVTFAFSTQKDMAGLTGYDPKTNVLSVTVKPVPAPHVERMQFTFDEPTTDEVTLTLRWEKLAVPLRLRVDTNGKTLAAARTAVAAAKTDDWRTPYRAASWAFDAGVAPEETAKWANSAAKVKSNFQTSGLLAKLAAKSGDKQTAVKLMKQSIAFGKADTTVAKEQVDTNEKLLAEWTGSK